MSKERIERLENQTKYLIEKQKELLTSSEEIFKSLINIIDEKIKTLKEDEGKDLQDVKVYIVEHNKKSNAQLKDDIEFLNEQLEAITQIKALDDEAKMEELLNMMLSKDQQLEEMDAFKKRLDEDVASCKKELEFMHEDIKGAIDEGKIRELKLMIEAVKDQQSKEDEDGDSCSGCCSGCSSEDSCGEDEGVDIFDAVKDEDSDK